MNGIIVVNKPQNYTSFDVIAILRKKLNQKKIGHMGTLDPMATGVLPILLGSTAKFQIFTDENEKEYIAEIIFGVVTDTWDIWGKVIEKNNIKVSKYEFLKILPQFSGKIKQVPPMYSAIKKDGAKLCDIARKGIVVEREPREVEIKNIELLDFNEEKCVAKIKILCSKGTYIRSLCYEIGQALGCGACMGNLKRTLSNSFFLSQSTKLETLKEMSFEKIVSDILIPTQELFKSNKSIFVEKNQADLFRNGISLKTEFLFLSENIEDNEIVKIFNVKKFIGIGKFQKNSGLIKFLKCEIEL